MSVVVERCKNNNQENILLGRKLIKRVQELICEIPVAHQTLQHLLCSPGLECYNLLLPTHAKGIIIPHCRGLIFLKGPPVEYDKVAW